MATTLGQHIEGKYELIEKLRDGGMGAIFKVRHRLLGEMRVIKLMRPQLQADEGLKARFMREARVAIKLKHPHIAQLYDFSVDDTGTAFIVMEYIDGLTLQDLILRIHPLPLSFVLEVAIQGLKALNYLHRKGFIHRDIAPDNLMVSEDEESMPFVKLIDLGIAKGLEAGSQPGLTKTGFFLGKVRYSSPEQFSPKAGAKIDARCDLYSFGIVLYEMLTARYPISGNAPSSLIAGHLLRAPLDFAKSDPDGRVPEALRAIVMQALAKKPDQRFADASDFARQLRKVQKTLDEPEEALTETLATARATPVPVANKPGSGGAQRQLDAQFGMSPTPVPREPTTQVTMHHLEKLDPEAPPPADDPSMATVVERPQQQPGVEMATVIGISHKVLIVKARAKLDKGDAKGALDQLQKAAELAPDNPEVTAAIAEVEAVLEKESSKRIEAEIAEMSAMIEGELGNNRLQAGEKLLKSALASFGEVEAFITLRQRLETQKQLASLLRQAADKTSDDDHQAATLLLREAKELEPENEELASRLVESEAALARTEGLAAAVEEVAGHLAVEDEEKADAAWKAAVERFGEDAALQPLRAQIDEAVAARTRQDGIAQALKTIEADLARNAIDAAERTYEVAVEGYGAEPFAAVKAQLDAQSKEAELEGYLGIARLYLGLGRYKQGLLELDKARDLEPEHPEIETLQGEIKKALAKKEAARKRVAAIDVARKAIEEKLEAGALDTARELLISSQDELGEDIAFVEVRLKLEEQERQAQLTAHLEVAEARLDEDDPTGAFEALSAARELEAEHPQLAALQTRAEEMRAAQEREEAVTAAVEAIEALLAAKKLDEAEAGIAAAVEKLGAADALTACSEKLTTARQRQQAEDLLRSAAALRKKKDFTAAISDLEEALRLVPKLEKAKKQLAATKRALRKHEEEERARALAAACEEIEAPLQDGDLDNAAARLAKARKVLGDDEKFEQLATRIEKERLVRRDAKVRELLLAAEGMVEEGQIDEARQHLETVRELDPENESARLQLESIDEIAAAVERIRKGEAIVKGQALAAAEPVTEEPVTEAPGPKAEAASPAEASTPDAAKPAAEAKSSAKPKPAVEGKSPAKTQSPAKAKSPTKGNSPAKGKSPAASKPAPKKAKAAAVKPANVAANPSSATPSTSPSKPAKAPRPAARKGGLPPWLVIALAVAVLVIIAVILVWSRDSGSQTSQFHSTPPAPCFDCSTPRFDPSIAGQFDSCDFFVSCVSIEEVDFLWSQV